jgi:hypothetical protein
MTKEILEKHTKEHDPEAYIKDLWEHIEVKLRKKGYQLTDVKKTIRAIRKQRISSTDGKLKINPI